MLILIPLLLQSCFTGVESTPKITYREVKDNKSGTRSAETTFSSQFKAEKYSEWENGKLFYVTSPKISLILSSGNPDIQPTMPVEGDTLVLCGRRSATDLTGKDIVELVFASRHNSNNTFIYRTGATDDELKSRQNVEVPFTIDLDLVKKTRDALAGRELYVLTPLWSDTEGNSVEGKKYVKVKVEDVCPANDVYPLKVLFTEEEGKTPYSVMMSAASENARWIPREFPAVFSFTDPHLEYPQISDEMWEKIIHGRVTAGMTKTEASLALGSPVSIDRGHDHSAAYERWRYSDGIYLIFEDGLLTRSNK